MALKTIATVLVFVGSTLSAGDQVVFNDDMISTTFSSRDVEEIDVNVNIDSPTISDRSGGTSNCVCVPSSYCQSPPSGTDGSGIIDIRIVTTPPNGVQCSSNLIYCCYIQQQTTIPPSGCGTRTPIRIQNVKLQPGQALFAEFPWSAIILGPDYDYIGGGVLVGPSHVLTAAHKVATCVNSQLKIRLGDWDIRSNTEPYGYIDYGVSNIYIHPQFNSANLRNDIAVIKLSQRAPIGVYPNINTACMTQQNTAFTGQRCTVAGWGKDAFGTNGKYQYIERKATVPVLSAYDCQTKLQTTRLGSQFQYDPTSFICAGGESGYDACTGDGGSALVCQQNGQFYVAGIVAWGIGCATKGVPGVYVNVPSYMNWINQKIAGY